MRLNLKKIAIYTAIGIFAIAVTPIIVDAAYAISQGGTNNNAFTNNSLTYFDGTKITSATTGSGISFSGGVLSATGSSFAYPFPSNATSTLLTFNSGLTAANPVTFSSLTAGTLNVTASGLVYNTATTSVAAGTGVSFTGTAGALIGGTNLTINNNGVVSLTNGTGISCSNVAGGSGSCSFANQSANTVLVNQSGSNGVPTGLATSTFGTTLYGVGTNGKVLAEVSGVPTWTATTTFSSGLAYSGGNVTNTGVLSTAGGTGLNCGAGTGAITCSLLIPVTIPNGGTGTTTDPISQLLYGGTNSYQSVATGTISNGTGITISGTGAVVGAGGITITNTGVTSLIAGTNISLSGSTGAITITGTGGGGTGLSTTSPVIGGNLLEYSAAGAGSAFGIGTSSIGAGTGLTFSGTAGSQVGGTNGTYSVNTTQNITTLSNLTIAGFVQTTSGGILSSAALTSGQVTTALALSAGTVNSNAAGTLYNTATSSVTNGTGISFTGTPGALIAGSALTISNSGLLSLQQNGGGTTQTGAIILSTTTDSYQGLSFGENITNSAGTFTFANNVAGTLNIGGGGTGLNSIGASSTVLTSNGTSAVWQAVTGGGGSGLTSIVGPTGLTFAGTPVSTATLSPGFSIKEVPDYTVCTSGCDFTTIQGALNAASSTNGTNGGATVAVIGAAFSQGATGIQIKSPNTTIQCNASTTISFTGATTGFSTNDQTAAFANDNIYGCTILGDGNTGGVAIDISSLNHSNFKYNTISNWGRGGKVDDKTNSTFYDDFSFNDVNAVSVVGFDGSSTNPWNRDNVTNNFFGCTTSGCTEIQDTNSNGNNITDNAFEPGSATNITDVKIFDNNIATCNGVFNNEISRNYTEGGGAPAAGSIGISISLNLCGNSGISRNIIENTINENHKLDWQFLGTNATSTIIAQNTWIGDIDSQFNNPLTTFQGPFGIATSSELENINQQPYAFFGVSPQAGVALNEFVIGSSTGTALLVSNAGFLGLGTTSPISRLTVNGGVTLHGLATGAGNGSVCATTDGLISYSTTGCTGSGGGTNFFSNTGNLTTLTTGSSLGIGSSTPWATLSVGTTTASSIALPLFAVASSTNLSLFVVDSNGSVGIGTSTPDVNNWLSVGSTTYTALSINRTTGQVGIGCENTGSTKWSFGCGSNLNVNPNINLLVTDPLDARLGTAVANQGVFMKSVTGSGGGLYAYDYSLGAPRPLILQEFGSLVGIGTTTPFAALSVVGTGVPEFAVASSTVSGSNKPNFEIDQNGHVITSGPLPTISACGTGTPTITGNDGAMIVTTGTTASSCTITFAHAYTSAPACVANEGDDLVATVNASSTPTAVVLTTGSGITAKQVSVLCQGIQ